VRVKPDDVHVRLGGAGSFTTVLNQPRFIAGIRVVTGVFAGFIPTEDTRDRPHFVQLTLWFDGVRLRGHASAILTGGRAQECLPAAVELTRNTAQP